MAWKKIDDDQALPDMPYSSFLANGLTVNANSYNNDMTRGGGIAWNATYPVTWSSYWTPQGFMFTVNVGQSVKQVDFRVAYATLTASADADGFQGRVTIKNIASSEYVTVGLLPSTSFSFLDISLPFNAAVTGPQAFALTFQSSKLEDLGIVEIRGGVQNTVYLDQRAGSGSYTITAGEKHELLDLTGVTSPSTGEVDTLNEYQINAISIDAPNPPDAYASVYPQLPSNPPRLVSNYDAPKDAEAHVFELGAMTLLGVAFNTVSANSGTAPPQLSHNTAAPLSAVIGIQNDARAVLQPDLCNGVSQRYALGAVIASDGTFPGHALAEQSTSFSFVTNAAVENLTLSVTFRHFGLRRLNNSKIRLTLRDDAGVLVVPQVDTDISIYPTNTPQSVIGITARDWYEPDASAAWGMRDSMRIVEMLAGEQFAINVPGLYLQPNTVYTVELVPQFLASAIYVYNLYARLILPIGSEG
jgi:hypothetical protein